MAHCYEVDCLDCPFSTAVIGDFLDAQAEATAHQEARDADPHGHFVNVRSADRFAEVET